MLVRSLFRGFCLAAAIMLAAPDLLADQGPPLQGEFRDLTLLDPPAPAPETRFFNDRELPVSLADFRGRLVLVNLWATWCPPCVYEMPSLDRLQGKLAGEGLTVLAVSVDKQGLDIVKPFLRDLAAQHLEAYIDPRGKLAAALGMTAVPTSYLIDGQGRIVAVMEGSAEWDSPEAVALLRHYLRIGAPADGGAVRTQLGWGG